MGPELGEWGAYRSVNSRELRYCKLRADQEEDYPGDQAGWAAGRATAGTGLQNHKAQMEERPAGGEKGLDSEYVLKAEEIQRS